MNLLTKYCTKCDRPRDKNKLDTTCGETARARFLWWDS